MHGLSVTLSLLKGALVPCTMRLAPSLFPPKYPEDFAGLGKSSFLVLRENEIPIHHNIKDTILAFDKFRLGPELIGNCGRQTGGLRQIVSRYTVGN